MILSGYTVGSLGESTALRVRIGRSVTTYVLPRMLLL